MKRPLAFKKFAAAMAALFVSVGRMIEHAGKVLLGDQLLARVETSLSWLPASSWYCNQGCSR